MDDVIGFIIVFVIFVLGPLLDQMRRSKQPPPPPPRQRQVPRPQPRVAYPQPTQESKPRPEYTQPHGTTTGDDERQQASTMVPAELWEILTGEKRPSPLPQPLPPDAELEEAADEEANTVEDVTVEVRRGRMEEAISLEELPRRAPPVVVSMETTPDPKRRHAQFHEKIADVATVQSTAPHEWLSTPAELRRAFVLQTILGPPKSLE